MEDEEPLDVQIDDMFERTDALAFFIMNQMVERVRGTDWQQSEPEPENPTHYQEPL